VKLLKPTDAPVVIVTELMQHYEMVGAFLFACDRASGVLYTVKIEEGLKHIGDTGIKFRQVMRGILVCKGEDTTCLVQKLMPPQEDVSLMPFVREVQVPISEVL